MSVAACELVSSEVKGELSEEYASEYEDVSVECDE